MSIFHYRIEIGNPQGTHFERVEALVDTGATFTMVPARVLKTLDVPVQRKARFRLADGRLVEREVGETKVRLDSQTVTTLVVFGEDAAQALLGVYTLEAALLAVDPVGQRLVPTEGLLMSSDLAARPATRR